MAILPLRWITLSSSNNNSSSSNNSINKQCIRRMIRMGDRRQLELKAKEEMYHLRKFFLSGSFRF